MKLYILGKDRIDLIRLNQNREEIVYVNYKYNETDEFPINIEYIDNNWCIKSNDLVDVLNGDLVVDSLSLKDYGYTILSLKDKNKKILVFSYPEVDTDYLNLDYGLINEFTIGSSNQCNINYKNDFIQPIHAVIKKVNEKWTIIQKDELSKIYVNNISVGKKELKVGDIIFINGLKIIWGSYYIRVIKSNNLMSVNGFKLYEAVGSNDLFDVSNSNDIIELYTKQDYYFPKLLLSNKLVEENVKIDPPPGIEKKDDVPWILTIGSSITMVGSSFMTTYNLVYNISQGKNLALLIPQIVMCITMILGSLLFPKILANYTKKQTAKKNKIRNEKYTAYLNEKIETINKLISEQSRTMQDLYPSSMDCMNYITDNKVVNINFWSREIKNDNFLKIRLGTGTLDSLIKVEAPESSFSVDEDELLTKVYTIKEESKKLKNVPITIDLKEKYNVGLMINNTYEVDYINSLILQIISLNNPANLKIVLLTNKEKEDRWKFLKYLPHCWTDDKQTRFFATTEDEIQTVSDYLVGEYKKRKEEKSNNSNNDNSLEVEAEQNEYSKEEIYKKFSPYYLIIDDNYNISKNSLIIKLLMETATNFGFSYLGIGRQLKDFSSECSTFIEVLEKSGNIVNKDENLKEMLSFSNEYIPNLDIRSKVKEISNIPIEIKDQESQLPTTLQFLEMLDVSRIEQLNIQNRWKTNNPVISLAVPIGVHTNSEKFKLDLHEKAHGPHGLVAGMTGSGKSEFLITYILSLIVNFHPYEVQFVLIDYKGGGLAGAFYNKETGMKIPHLAGVITNLDTAEMNRTLVSIQSECTRRQKKFNEVRDKLGESTIDIYKYQKLYREGLIDEPMSHLFIISDEFAELKAQQPDFMQNLISVARIGRSLGIHLILATQKPSGVVNDQIWSNSKFKVCLKVQDRSDSQEMLKKPDAASIKETGRFYLQVGYDDYFDIGQSGWTGAKYIPSDIIIKNIDDSINFVNNTGYQIKNIKSAIKVDNTVELGDQLTNTVKYVCELAKTQNINPKQLWLDAISENIYVSELKNKYNYQPTSYLIAPVIGEYDDPKAQRQGLLNLDLTNKGNTLIYGENGSGKEMLISTIITSTCLEHTPEEVNFYILDFGSETLKKFYKIPHIGDIITVEEPDKVKDTFEMLFDEMESRKKLFVDYSGNYNEYIRSSGNKLPLIVVIINNYDIFVENNSRLADNIMNIYRDAPKYGIIFILTTLSSSGVRGKMAQNFENKICLKLPDKPYRDLLGAERGLEPADYKGRGIIRLDDNKVFEFQTAKFTDSDELLYVKKMADAMNSAYTYKASPIKTVPSIIYEDNFSNEQVKLERIPIGYGMENKLPYYYEITNSLFTPILTNNMTDEKMSFIYSYINMLSRIENAKVKVVDLIEVFEKNINDLALYNDNWEENIIKIYNDVITNKDSNITNIYVFLGIGQLSKVIPKEIVPIINKLFMEVDLSYSVKFILIDVYASYKNITNEDWYQAQINKGNGIWLGNEVGSQLAININNLSMDDRKVDFPYMAFAVKNNNKVIIKHMIEAEVEDNEG